MLITLPWFIAVYAGRVPIDKDGKCIYSKRVIRRNSSISQVSVLAFVVLSRRAMHHSGRSW